MTKQDDAGSRSGSAPGLCRGGRASVVHARRRGAAPNAGTCHHGRESGTCPGSLRRLAMNDGLLRLPMAEIRLHRAPGFSIAGRLLADHLVAAIAKTPV